MADLNVNITVTDLTDDGAGSGQPTTKESAETARVAFTVNRAMSIGKQLATQGANNAIASIGIQTGNYVLQEQLQTSMSVVTKTIGIATAFAANPLLGAVALVGEGIGMGFNIWNRQTELIWQNRQASELRRRAGYLTDNR